MSVEALLYDYRRDGSVAEGEALLTLADGSSERCRESELYPETEPEPPTDEAGPRSDKNPGTILGGNIVKPPSNIPKLEDLGIDKMQSERWQLEATRRAIIEHNRYRIKNGQQLYNEGKELESIEAERARQTKNQADKLERTETGQFVPKPVTEIFREVDKHERETSAIVAQTIGLGSGKQWDKLKHIALKRPGALFTIKPGIKRRG